MPENADGITVCPIHQGRLYPVDNADGETMYWARPIDGCDYEEDDA